MSGVRWVVWDEWCELCEMRGVRWVVWDEWCEMSCEGHANIIAATQICHRDTSSANANINAATLICRRDTSSANANKTAATQICHRDTSSANAKVNAATQICRRDTSSANANKTAATQICHRDTSSAKANITAATQICRRNTSSANANITAATQICHRDTSSANANITAAAQICRRDTSSANANKTAATQICHRDTSSANANCGNTDLSQKHLLCKRQYNCGDTDLSQRHLLCKRQYNCGNTGLSHRHLFYKRQYNGGDKPATAMAATIRAAAPSGSPAYCPCHAKASRGHCGDYPRRRSFRKLCVLRLPHKSEPRPRRRLSAPQLLEEALRTAPATQKRAAATAATIRAAAPSGSSAHCTCHTKASRGHGGDYPRRSSFRKLCILHLPRKSEPRPRRQLLQEALRTAPATQKRAAATAATIRAAAFSGSSAYCACHAKASRGHDGDYPRHSSFRKLFALHLPRKSEPRPWRRLSARQLLQEALRAAPATQKRAAATAATIRAAAPSGSSAYCTCHVKASRGHSGDYPRRSSFGPSGSSAYCACHAKASRGHGGDYPRRSSFRKLCVLRLPSNTFVRWGVWDELCEMSCVRDELCEMSCVWDELCVGWVVCEMSCVRWVVWDEWCEMSGVRWVVWDELCVRWVVCEMSCVRWVVWDELCVRWIVWDELCEMNCVRWIVWDELCVRWIVWDELCVRWVVWDEMTEARRTGRRRRTGDGRDANKKTKTPQWCGEQRKIDATSEIILDV